MTKLSGAAGPAAALLFLALPAAASAQAAAPAAPVTGAAITRAQGEQMVRGMFAQVDANSDGVVDPGEVKALLDALKGQVPEAGLAHVGKIFRDAAGPDGKVTVAAFVAARLIAFDKADTNHDGKLDAAEQAAAKAAVDNAKN